MPPQAEPLGEGAMVQQVNPKTQERETKMLHSINAEQKLYVIPCGRGFSTLGFEYARKMTKAVAIWLNRPDLEPTASIGTEEAFEEYKRAMACGSNHNLLTGERCGAELTPQLVGLEGWQVEVVDSYGEKRRFIVGKSMGWCPCHLEIVRRGSSGGPAVMGAPFSTLRKIEKIR